MFKKLWDFVMRFFEVQAGYEEPLLNEHQFHRPAASVDGLNSKSGAKPAAKKKSPARKVVPKRMVRQKKKTAAKPARKKAAGHGRRRT